MKPTSGELHVARYGQVRKALDAINELWETGAIAHMPDEDISRLLKARARLMLVRYHGSRSTGNGNVKHGCGPKPC